ncbi:MAG: S41 family peptidase [Lachnospiraceae bacterium]|nr:S41 family peptidase [Lachnospiraceae bacterium]
MDNYNQQFSEQQSFDMHEIGNPVPPKKQKSRFGLGFLVGALVGAAVILIGVVVYSFITYRKMVDIYSGAKTYEYATYQEKLETIMEYLELYYIGEVDEEELRDGLSEGLLSGIDDKYAKYYTKEEFDRMMEDSSGEYCGIGVSITQDESGAIVVYKVFKGTPAEEADIHPMDVIIEAAGERNFADLDALVALVRGEEGTTIDLVVLRDGEEIPITVQRRKIVTPSIESKMLDDHIGYIAISEFDRATVTQFNDAITELEEAGMEALIIDVRDNPGGDYDSVVAMADRVLPKGTIITTKNKQGTVKEEVSDDEHQLTIPMVVLVNANTASAAELFSGAIQDYGLADIVGQQTYGKGVVQSIYRLNDGSGMKFTTETYYTPSGRSVDGEGVIPDYEVELPDEVYEDGIVTEEEDVQLQKAIELLGGGQE